jgi:hypothetical protein
MIEKALSESDYCLVILIKFLQVLKEHQIFLFHLSIGSGAKNDLTKHAKSQNHMQLEMVQRKSKSMSLFVTTPNNSLKSNIEQFWGSLQILEQKQMVDIHNNIDFD